MAEAWQTLEEAALTLGISSRTLHRRLARGEFQTRMENGRREVLVVIDEVDPSLQRLAAAARRGAAAAEAAEMSDMADGSAMPPEPEAPAADDYGRAIDNATDEVGQTMLALHEDRIRRTDLAIMAYQQSVTVAAADARRAITRSRVAWGVAATLTIVAFLSATWATHHVTKVNAEVSHLSANVRQLSDTVESKSRELQELRHDSQAAKVAAARAEGELTAAKMQIGQLLDAQQAAQARLAAQLTQAETSATPATQPATAVSPSAAQPSATTTPALPVPPVPPPVGQGGTTTPTPDKPADGLWQTPAIR
jgi:outer membrane murein-binding lipoprotein Lpp